MPHLIIIFLVALIVFGPEKLPELARNFGKIMAEFKRATGDLKAGFEEHMRDLERETRQSEYQAQSVQSSNTILPPAEVTVESPSAPADAVTHSAEEPAYSETASEKPANGD